VDDYRHYLFNPRDLTQWVFGLLRYDLTQQNLLDVWAHEAYRLFADRLVAQPSLKAFEGLLGGLLRTQWNFELKLADVYFTALATVAPTSYADKKEGKGSSAKETKSSSSSSAAGPSAIGIEMGKQLERIPSGDFKEMVTQGLYNYEREFKGLNMLLFPEILDHLAFEDRVLSRPGGSLLLIGDRGVGRRTSVTLVSFMQHIRMWTPNVSNKYDLKAFRADLKEQLKVTHFTSLYLKMSIRLLIVLVLFAAF
jgi:dynein heavy chain 2